ncbi:MAG TPA: pitrilysin family protein [Polyangia bacterium]
MREPASPSPLSMPRRRKEEAPPFRRHKDVLPNGLRVVTVELPHLHTASVVMYAKVGSRYETARSNGLSHFLEHMLFRGTERLPDAYQLNRAIEALGGTLYAETGRDYSLYQISLHPESLAEGIALFGEIFTTPTFADLEVERRIVLEEMLEDLDEDGRLVNIDDIARQAVWPDHPLGWRITGPLENVERFAPADVKRHFAGYYGARNMVLCVSGAVEHARVREAALKAMRAIPPGRELPVRTPKTKQASARFVSVDHDGSQTSAQLLFRGLPELEPDYPSLMMLSRIVDDGMSTRLHRRLCDELGLAYYVSGSLEPFVDTGLFEIDASAHHASVPELVRESLRLVSELRDHPVDADELDKARRRYRWDLERSFDDADAMAGWWGGTELFYGPQNFAEKLARVERVTPESVREAARKVFRPERLTVACVGALGKRAAAKLEREVAAFR